MIIDGVNPGAVMVPLAPIAPHPMNFRRSLVDLDELATSIGGNGLDEPLVVMPADRVAAAWPDHAETLSGHKWVLLWGHRRLAAARHAFADDPAARVPAIIRNDEVCDNAQMQLDLMTRNALAHRSWNPIEEACAFQASVNAGRTQVEIAEMCGCHQSHVSGRLALLRLPEEIAEVVAAGQLRVADARKLARLDDHEQMRAVWRMYLDRREDAWITSIDQAITEHADRLAYQARRQASLERARGQGLQTVDPIEEFGRDVGIHRLEAASLIEAARSAGTLVAGVSGDGDLEYYTTNPVAKSDSGPPELERNRRRAAAAARERAGRLLAAKPPAIPVTAAHVVDSLLRSAPDGWRPIAQRWLRWLQVGTSSETDPERWWREIFAADWNTRVWAAHCIALASFEHSARTHHHWDEEDMGWLRRLISEGGYLPRRWERDRLDRGGNPLDDIRPDWSSDVGGWVRRT